MSKTGFFIKAELFSFIFMTMMVWTWFRIKAHPNKTWSLFYLFPLLMLLWINSHGGFIFGIVFLGLVLVGEVINWITGSSERLDPQHIKHLFIAIIISGLTVLITPYGWRYPIQLLNNLVLNPKEFSKHMSTTLAYFSIYDPRSTDLALIGFLITSLGILIILLFTQIRKSKIDWTLLFVNVPFIIIYIKYIRASYFWAIIFVFSSIYLIRKMSQDNLRLLENKPLKLVIHTITLILLLIIVLRVQYFKYGSFIHGYYIYPPVIEAEYIRSKFPHLRMGNDYDSGAYLLWSLWPAQKVFIDARYFPYHTWYDEYNEFVYGQDKTLKDLFIKKHECDLWCLSINNPQIVEYFVKSPNWKLVYYGPSACIFLSKRIPYPPGHEISSSIYKVNSDLALTISGFAAEIGDFDVSKRLLTKLRTPQFYAQNQDTIDQIENKIATKALLQEIKDKITLLQNALMTHPGNSKLIQELALYYARIGDYENAIANLKILLNQNPEKPEVYYNIACIYAKQNMSDKSIELLKLSIEKGFHNWDLIKHDPDLDNIRNTAFINELIKNH
jgi:tetratricopeptide (TPR) repeat protein